MMLKDFDFFIQYCIEHGGSLKSHREFGQMARDLRSVLREREEESVSQDLINIARQWFDSLQDLHPDILEPKDYESAWTLYKMCGMKVPKSIVDGAKKSERVKCRACGGSGHIAICHDGGIYPNVTVSHCQMCSGSGYVIT